MSERVVVLGGGLAGVACARPGGQLPAARRGHRRGGGPTGVETTGALAELMLALHKFGRLGVGVTAVHPDGVQFDDGSAISTRTVVRGGGESASAIAQVESPTTTSGDGVTIAGCPHSA